MRIIQYNTREFSDKNITSGEAVGTPHGSQHWFIVRVDEEKTVETVAEQFNIHHLIKEDIQSLNHLPKTEAFEEYMFLAHHYFHSPHPAEEISRYQFSHILGENFLITFTTGEAAPILEPVIARIQNVRGMVRKRQADYLLYLIVDLCVDQYLQIAEEYRDYIDELEDTLIDNTPFNPTETVQDMKQNIRRMRKFAVPLKGITNFIKNSGSYFVRDENLLYWQDINDHLINFTTSLETLREMLRDITELYQANLNTETNQVMKTLTIVATIFIPLTFVAGIYGMNFKHMPELNQPWAYPVLLIIMLVITLLMLGYMRYKKWF